MPGHVTKKAAFPFETRPQKCVFPMPSRGWRALYCVRRVAAVAAFSPISLNAAMRSVAFLAS